MTGEKDAPPLRWAELPAEARAQLEGRLAGLYGHATDESAFDSLAEDKRRTLLIFVRRFERFGLWHAVERVTNVYGEGGVGIAFVAAEEFPALLGSHARFTPRFAGHGGKTAGGFYEKQRARRAPPSQDARCAEPVGRALRRARPARRPREPAAPPLARSREGPDAGLARNRVAAGVRREAGREVEGRIR